MVLLVHPDQMDYPVEVVLVMVTFWFREALVEIAHAEEQVEPEVQGVVRSTTAFQVKPEWGEHPEELVGLMGTRVAMGNLVEMVQQAALEQMEPGVPEVAFREVSGPEHLGRMELQAAMEMVAVAAAAAVVRMELLLMMAPATVVAVAEPADVVVD